MNQIQFKDRKTAFVGGLWDDKNKFVKFMYQSYGTEKDVYFEHHQKKQLATWIDENNSTFFITVIGHSYGGNSAARVVASGHPVDILVTVDPVGRFKPDFIKVTKFSGNWLNFVATGGGLYLNNIVARLGGWYGHKPKGYADQHTLAPDKDHVAICFQYCKPLS